MLTEEVELEVELMSVTAGFYSSKKLVKIDTNTCVYVVQFGFWFNLDFPLFFSMLIYDNEYQIILYYIEIGRKNC